MNSETGIESNIIFYAQWEKISDTPDNKEQTQNTNSIEVNKNNNTEKINNPQTSDNIMFYVLILSISTLGIIITTKTIKIKQRN